MARDKLGTTMWASCFFKIEKQYFYSSLMEIWKHLNGTISKHTKSIGLMSVYLFIYSKAEHRLKQKTVHKEEHKT